MYVTMVIRLILRKLALLKHKQLLAEDVNNISERKSQLSFVFLLQTMLLYLVGNRF